MGDQGNRLPEIITYLKQDRDQHGLIRDPGQPPVVIHYHEAARPEPPPPPPPDVLAKYIPYFVLMLFGMIILTGCGVIAYLLAASLAAIMMSLAVAAGALAIMAIAIASCVRSFRKESLDDRRSRKGRRR